MCLKKAPCKLVRCTKGATIRFPEGGQEYLSRANHLFQPGSAARWKFHILWHVYMEQFLK